MSAREVAKALGGLWHGSSGMCRCPCHQDKTPSLQISDGSNGELVVHCHAGCAWQDVKAALRSQGVLPEWTPDRTSARTLLMNGQPINVGGKGNGTARVVAAPAKAPEPENGNRQHALNLWNGASPAGAVTRAYLAGRGISIDPPASIREMAELKHGPTGLPLPAILCAVQSPDRQVVAIHRTFLKRDYSAKANVSQARMMLGPMSGNVVRLGPAAEKIALAEGLENGLSIAQACPDLPVWCCLSVSNLAPHLPDQVTDVVMCLDGDDPGSKAFQVSEQRIQELLSRGLTVRVFRAPLGLDHNDLLRLPGSTNTTISLKGATYG